MEHLKILAKRLAELAYNSKFPIEQWLNKYSIRLFMLGSTDDWYQVDFGEISLKQEDGKWIVNGRDDIVNDLNALFELGSQYQEKYEAFLNDLPVLKADYIRKEQIRVIELQEELNQVAA